MFFIICKILTHLYFTIWLFIILFLYPLKLSGHILDLLINSLMTLNLPFRVLISLPFSLTFYFISLDLCSGSVFFLLQLFLVCFTSLLLNFKSYVSFALIFFCCLLCIFIIDYFYNFNYLNTMSLYCLLKCAIIWKDYLLFFF